MQASLELQRGLVAALQADAALSAHGLAIYDGPPSGAPSPYLSVGEDIARFRGWKGGGGVEHRFAVTLWDLRESFASAKAILADVERVVLMMPRQFGRSRLVWLRLLRGTVKRTKRNWTQGTLEFAALSVEGDGNGS